MFFISSPDGLNHFYFIYTKLNIFLCLERNVYRCVSGEMNGERRIQNALSQNTQHRKTCQLFNDNQRVEPNPWFSCLFQHSVNSTYLTAYHNVHLTINSSFFFHSLTYTGMTDYSVVHKTFMYLLSALWPNSYIHTVLPPEVRQWHQMLSRRMKNMLLALLTPAPCRWTKHPCSKSTTATLMRQTMGTPRSGRAIMKFHR